MNLSAVLALTVFIAIFGTGLAFLASLFGPRVHQSKIKKQPYESGLESESTETTKIPVKFYLTAILFILFDIEIIFMYPWAVAYGDSIEAGHGLSALIVMGLFVGIFVYGLFWEIKSNALEWD
jgi:NADH-quinone oxidoreductase subunit A